MSASKIVSGVALAWHSLTGFLEKHIDDLKAVGGALADINASLPIDAQDKERIANAIAVVETSANNIANWLANAPANPGEVTLKESDIVNSLSNYFNSEAGKAALAAAVNPTPQSEEQENA
jgi:hypothetical protein